MWCNHPFSQKNKTTERAVGVGVGDDREGGGGGRGWTKFEKGEVANIGAHCAQNSKLWKKVYIYTLKCHIEVNETILKMS